MQTSPSIAKKKPKKATTSRGMEKFEIEEVSRMTEGWGVTKRTPKKGLKKGGDSSNLQKGGVKQSGRRAPADEEWDEIRPRKKPMRENIIKYTPSSALMNHSTQKKPPKRRQDIPAAADINNDQWIGAASGSDSDWRS